MSSTAQPPVEEHLSCSIGFSDLADQIAGEHPKFAEGLRSISDSPFYDLINPAAINAFTVLIQKTLNGDSTQKNLDFLFKNLILDKRPDEGIEEKVDRFKRKHIQIYSKHAVLIADALTQGTIDHITFLSGMHGGKSTIAFLTMDKLIKQGFEPIYLVADVLGELHIRSRALNQTRPAIPFGELLCKDDNGYDTNITNSKKLFELLENKRSEQLAIFLDEFSFTNPELVIKLLGFSGPNVKVMLAGLDTNFNGVPLPFQAEQYRHQILHANLSINGIDQNALYNGHCQCYSFVPNLSEDEPRGTHTVRYLQIPLANGGSVYLRDLGIGPLIISKDLRQVVCYAPAMDYQSTVEWFKGYDGVAEAILNPDIRTAAMQEEFLQNSIRHFGANES